MFKLFSALADLVASLVGFAFYFGIAIGILSLYIGGLIVSFNENLIWFAACLLCFPVSVLSGFAYWFGG